MTQSTGRSGRRRASARRAAPALACGLVLLAAGLSTSCAGPAPAARTAADVLGPGFEHGFAKVNGTTLHYVRGGTGPAVMLLHGFPQDWYEFRHVMPHLAQTFTVIAVDLRGVGRSAPAETGYDAANLAEDVHQLATHLRLDRPYVVGHDIGGIVAYALGRRYPASVRGMLILDVAFPGLPPWDEIVAGPAFWHVRFHQTNLPEQLVAGRQAAYFRYFLSGPAFTDRDVEHFVQAYRHPDHLRSAFETYRAFPATASFNQSQRSAIDVPLVLGAGEHDAFTPFLARIAQGVRDHGWTDVTIEVIADSAHYVFEEQPDAVAALIERYAGGPAGEARLE